MKQEEQFGGFLFPDEEETVAKYLLVQKEDQSQCQKNWEEICREVMLRATQIAKDMKNGIEKVEADVSVYLKKSAPASVAFPTEAERKQAFEGLLTLWRRLESDFSELRFSQAQIGKVRAQLSGLVLKAPTEGLHSEDAFLGKVQSTHEKMNALQKASATFFSQSVPAFFDGLERRADTEHAGLRMRVGECESLCREFFGKLEEVKRFAECIIS